MNLFDESRDNKSIEDYLFSGYKPHMESTSDTNRDFAQPIEDEDLFTLKDVGDPIVAEDSVIASENICNHLDFDDRPFGRLSDEPVGEKDVDSPGQLFEDDTSTAEIVSQELPGDSGHQVDDIFIDDYTNSGDHVNNENERPNLEKSYSKSKPVAPLINQAQIKRKLMRERLRQQVIAMNLKRQPKLASSFSNDDSIELCLEQSKLVSNSTSKFIFNKLFNKSKKASDANGSPQSCKTSYAHQEVARLRKQISTQKRKIWNSFQAPMDAFDDEEELIESHESSGSGKPTDQIEKLSDEDGANQDPDESDCASIDEIENDVNDLEESDVGESTGDINDASLDQSSRESSDVSSDLKSDEDDEEEIVTRKKKADKIQDSVRGFIDDEVEVDENLYR